MTDPIARLRELVSAYQTKPSNNTAHDIAELAPAVVRLTDQAARAVVTATVPAPPAAAAGDPVRELLAKAAAIAGTRAAKLAMRIEASLAELQPLVDKAEKERELQQQIDKLAAELHRKREELRAATRPAATTVVPSTGSGPKPAVVRKWAIANGYSVSTAGIVPKHLFDAYAQAHGDA